MKLFKSLIVFGFLLGATLEAEAVTNKVDGLPIKLGDSIPQVKSAFAVDIDPTPITSDDPDEEGMLELHLRTRGVWTYFNDDDLVDSIQLDAPFKGSVAGLHIGDSVAQMNKLLGEPVKKPQKSGETLDYLYYPDDNFAIDVFVNIEGQVESILIHK